MKTVICIMLAVALLFSTAITEELYNFISLGDYGVLLTRLLPAIGFTNYTYTDEDEPIFDEYVLNRLLEYQAEHGIAETGCFDFETLHYILRLDGVEHVDSMVWVPMHGGKRHHTKETCSEMIEPQQMPVDCAEGLGFTACGICGIHPAAE